MDCLAVLAIVLSVAGILGAIVPMLPGPPLSWAALLCLYFSVCPHTPLTATALFVWLAVAAVITVLDYVIPPLMTKLMGGHKEAERGALIGMIAGIFLTPVGMIVGSLLGAFIGEFLSADQDFATSLKATLGVFVGFILTTGLKLTMSGIVLWEIISHLFF